MNEVMVDITFSGTLEKIKKTMREFLDQAPPVTDAPLVSPVTDAPLVSPVTDAHQAPPVTDAHQVSPVTDAHQVSPVTDAHQVSPVSQGIGFQTGHELDADGFPWDARINTSNKGKTAKGVWKRKPGLAEGVYEQIRTELKSNCCPPVTQTPPHLDVVPDMTPPVTQTPHHPDAVPDMTPPVVRVLSWVDFMREITARNLDPTAVQNACVNAGVADVTALQDNPSTINAVAEALGIL